MEAVSTTCVMLAFILVWGVVVPLLDGWKKTRKYISLRYCLVIPFCAMMLGVIIDFSHLTEQVRLAVIIGTLVMVGIFILCRTVEKWLVLGVKMPRLRARHGDTELEIGSSGEAEKKGDKKDDDDVR